jgi:uncharacterized protein (TIGR00251 family)
MLLTVYVKPNSRSNTLSWLDQSTLRVGVSSPAKDGKANKELINYLSKYFETKKTSIMIVRGNNIRIKHIKIPNFVYNKKIIKENKNMDKCNDCKCNPCTCGK